MESKWGYQLTQKADADLDDIMGYIAVELANPTAASDFVDKLQGAIEEARSFPESGSLVISEFIPNTEVRKSRIFEIQVKGEPAGNRRNRNERAMRRTGAE